MQIVAQLCTNLFLAFCSSHRQDARHIHPAAMPKSTRGRGGGHRTLYDPKNPTKHSAAGGSPQVSEHWSVLLIRSLCLLAPVLCPLHYIRCWQSRGGGEEDCIPQKKGSVELMSWLSWAILTDSGGKQFEPTSAQELWTKERNLSTPLPTPMLQGIQATDLCDWSFSWQFQDVFHETGPDYGAGYQDYQRSSSYDYPHSPHASAGRSGFYDRHDYSGIFVGGVSGLDTHERRNSFAESHTYVWCDKRSSFTVMQKWQSPPCQHNSVTSTETTLDLIFHSCRKPWSSSWQLLWLRSLSKHAVLRQRNVPRRHVFTGPLLPQVFWRDNCAFVWNGDVVICKRYSLRLMLHFQRYLAKLLFMCVPDADRLCESRCRLLVVMVIHGHTHGQKSISARRRCW